MKVIVIGGGASGMMAALTAAENGHQVTILERQARLGRKLLATGNGRCNLSNMNMGQKFYHGARADLASRMIGEFDTAKTLEFFSSLGLLTVSEPSGRVYPFSDQAGSVVDVLRFALDQAGVEIITGFEVVSARNEKGKFVVASAEEALTADRLIICCGGMAGAKLGGTKSGYELLKSFGHKMTKLYPSLVQIKTDDAYTRSLKGVRADAGVSLVVGKYVEAESAGEVQFTEYGLSGPAIFEISRAASVNKEKRTVVLDLLREYSKEDIEELISARISAMPSLTAENLLTGMLQNRLGRTVLKYAGYDQNLLVTELNEDDISRIAKCIKSFRFDVIDTLSFDSAQVTAGGADITQFRADTLESRLVKGLYAAGEVLDVDGDCGGYNLQWAWSSGRRAGMVL